MASSNETLLMFEQKYEIRNVIQLKSLYRLMLGSEKKFIGQSRLCTEANASMWSFT